MQLYKENNKESQNWNLLATRPLETRLKTDLEAKSQLQTRLKQKSLMCYDIL